MTTNGLALDEEFLDLAVANDLMIAMSLDGVRRSHDRHRRLPDGRGSFGRLLPKLRMLLAARPYSSVLMTVNPDTVREYAESVCFLLDEGVRYLIVSLNYAGRWTEEALQELRRQYERLGDLYVEWTRRERKFYLSPFEVKLCSHINGRAWREDRCQLGIRQISVDPRGYLYPCVQFTAAGPQSRWCIGHVATGIDEAAQAAVARRVGGTSRRRAPAARSARAATIPAAA